MAEPVREAMENLRDATDAESLAEVIRRALAVYAFVCDETKRGSTVVVRTPTGEYKDVLVV